MLLTSLGFNTQNYIYPFQNLSIGFILKIFLKFRKFQSRYSYKIYSYKKKSVLFKAAFAECPSTGWVLMWTHPFFKVSTLEFGHVAVGRVKGRRLCTPAQQWAPGSCVHTVFVIYGAVHCSSCYAHVSNGFCKGEMQ